MSSEWIVLVCFMKHVVTITVKKVYVQVIRSTARRYFRGRQHGPARKCIHPKNKPTKNARNHGNVTKRTSELHERAKIPRKDSNAICSLVECRKGFNFCWTSKANVEPKLAQQKIDVWEARIRGAYVHAFQTNGQIGHTCLGPPKLRWPRGPRSLNPSLLTGSLFSGPLSAPPQKRI